MMSQIVRILLWEIWRRNRLKLIAMAAFTLVSWVLMITFAPEIKDLGTPNRMIYMPMIATILYLLMVFIYAEVDPKSHYTGFPSHPLLLPVSTGMLVACPMICGMLVIPLTYAAWVLFGFRPAGFDLSLGMPMLLLATAMVWFQGISWSLGRHPLLSGACLALLISLLLGLNLSFSGYIFEKPGPVLKVAILSAFPLLIFLAWRLAVFGVERQRWNEVFLSLPKLEFGFRVNRKPFSSPGRAMFAFEWRHFGLILPGTLVMMCSVLLILPLTKTFDESGFWLIVGFSNLLLPMCGSLMGMELAKPFFGAKETGLDAFRSALPLTDWEIAGARLKTAALSLGAALVVQWLFVFGWAAATGHTHTLIDLFSRLIKQNGMPVFLAEVAVFYWILLGGAWGAMANSIVLGWAIGKRLFAILGSCWLGLYVVSFMAGLWLSRHEEAWTAFKAWLPYLGWLLCVLLVCLCFMVFRAAQRKGFLSPSLVRWVIGIGLVAIGLAWFLLTRPPLDSVQTTPMLLAFVDLTLLGLIPLAGAPLALARKRHR